MERAKHSFFALPNPLSCSVMNKISLNQIERSLKASLESRSSSTTSEVSKYIHTDNPNDNITLENTKILSAEHKWFERGVKEAIYIRVLSFTKQRLWTLQLAPVWNNIIKERLVENGAGTTNGSSTAECYYRGCSLMTCLPT